MDIKLKNKLIYICCIIISMHLISFSILTSIDFSKKTDFIAPGGYFKSNAFNNILSTYVYDLIPYLKDYKNYEQKSDDEKITAEEINNREEQYKSTLQSHLDSISDQYKGKIEYAKNTDNTGEVKIFTSERDNLINEEKEEYSKKLTNIKKDLVSEHDKEYNELKNSLQLKSHIKYYLKDKSTDAIVTNILHVDNIDNYIKDNSLFHIKFPSDIYSDSFNKSMNAYFSNQGFNGYLIIMKNSDDFKDKYNSYSFMRNQVTNECVFMLISFVIGVSLFIFARRKLKIEITSINKIKAFYRKLPLEIKILLLLLFSFAIYKQMLYAKLFSSLPFTYYSLDTTTFALYLLFLWLNFVSMINICKNKDEMKNQLKNSITSRIISFKDVLFINRGLMFKLVIMAILTAIFGICFFIFIVGFDSNTYHFNTLYVSMRMGRYFINEFGVIFAFLYIIFYIILAAKYAFKKIKLLNDIIIDTDRIASGNFSGNLNETGNGNLPRLAHNINTLQEGIKKSLEEQIKSERLKSELISNVSHDLKTPLTTIINYVDILKRDELTNEEIHDYITILDRKAQRLKVLIEDLFEASKVTSGAVELNIEKVEIVALLNQALAEFEEKIKASAVIFKINIPHKKIYADLDGKKTWRVFENLINNILKYSQSNTRAYIDLSEENSHIIITMKNISAYELDFNVEEIFERFKRGDKSRNTEGSGLGLAIAKSIVELENGKLEIQVDGDLFKATVTFKQSYK